LARERKLTTYDVLVGEATIADAHADPNPRPVAPWHRPPSLGAELEMIDMSGAITV